MNQNGYDNEKFLMEQLKSGSEHAYAHLFGKYHRELCNYMTAISGNTRLAEDLAQQAFIKLWDKRQQLSIKENHLKSYLFRIAYNLFIDTQRKRQKEYALLEILKQEAYLELAETDSSLFEERLKLVEAEIENLPDQCRKVFLMGKKEGLKYREISEKLQISVKTVEVHMAKALKRLRAQLSLFF